MNKDARGIWLYRLGYIKCILNDKARSSCFILSGDWRDDSHRSSL